MRAVEFGNLRYNDWFVYNAIPYRSGEMIFRGTISGENREPLIPCINMLTNSIENFRLKDVVLILDNEDLARVKEVIADE